VGDGKVTVVVRWGQDCPPCAARGWHGQRGYRTDHGVQLLAAEMSAEGARDRAVPQPSPHVDPSKCSSSHHNGAPDQPEAAPGEWIPYHGTCTVDAH
jgi:hypothetical protein